MIENQTELNYLYEMELCLLAQLKLLNGLHFFRITIQRGPIFLLQNGLPLICSKGIPDLDVSRVHMPHRQIDGDIPYGQDAGDLVFIKNRHHAGLIIFHLHDGIFE